MKKKQSKEKNNATCTSQEADRISASIEALSEIQSSFTSKDPIVINKNISLMMRQAYIQHDLSFCVKSLVNSVLNLDLKTQFHALSALSSLAPLSPNMLSIIAPTLLSFLNEPLILPRVLKFFSTLINQNLFSYCKGKIIEISQTTNQYHKKLCLHLMYSAYLHDQTLIKPLFKIAKASILDFPLSSLSVILEITKTHPNLVHQIQGLLISLMKCCDSLCYYKLCQIFINTLELDATIVDKLRTILSDPLFQDSDHLIPSILLLSKLPDSQALINVYGKTLENSINSSQNPNEYYSIITAFSALKGKYTPSDPDCLKLLTSSSDNFIRVLALEQLDLPLSTLRTTVGSLISDKTVITSPILLEQVLNIAPQVGSWYITLLFNIHDMKIPGTNSILRSTLKTVTDRLTKELFISEVRIYLQELPDDDFGIGLAEMIAEDSDQFKDIYSLVPLNIASRSIEFQVAALDLTFEFVIRMQNQIKNGIVNRLENLCFSHSRKVRQRASELIFIINELQTSVSN